jgi:transcriptional regulator with XRE-family HTH domain
VDEQALGRRIRVLREARGWSQERLAERAAIHAVYLSGLENGKRNPSFKVLVRLATALDVTLAELFAEPPGASTRPPGRTRTA